MRFGDEPGMDDTVAELRWQEMCPQIPFEIIAGPRKISAAHDVANWCIEASGSTLKTAIECSIVMKPFIDQVLARGYRTLLNGMSGGMLWGVGRQAMMQLHRVSLEKGDAAGLKHWQDLKRRWLEYERTGFPPNATRVCRWHTESKGGIWYDPLALRVAGFQGPIAVVRNNEGGLDLDLDFGCSKPGIAGPCNSAQLLAIARLFEPGGHVWH